MAKKSNLKFSDFDYQLGKKLSLFDIVKKVHPQEQLLNLGGEFCDPETLDKSLFSLSSEGYLLTGNEYDYAFVSALSNVCAKHLDAIAAAEGEEKEEEQEPFRNPKYVTEALNNWTEKNKCNSKLVYATYVLNSASISSYYSRSQGPKMAETVGLNKLDKYDTIYLMNLCDEVKRGCKESIEQSKSKFISKRTAYTHEGQRQRMILKTRLMYDQGDIDEKAYKDKMEWATSENFQSDTWRKSSYSNDDPSLLEEADFDGETEEALYVATEFSKELAFHAIEKEGLWLPVKNEE